MGNIIVSISVAENPTGSDRSAEVLIAGRTVFIFQTSVSKPGLGAALGFVPIPPCRVTDTRSADGPLGGPLLARGTSRDFTLPLSQCGIPASALAYALNVTVVLSGSLGYLAVSPSGTQRPVVSTLDSFDGRVKANAAIVAASSAGAINVYATNDTHLVHNRT